MFWLFLILIFFICILFVKFTVGLRYEENKFNIFIIIFCFNFNIFSQTTKKNPKTSGKFHNKRKIKYSNIKSLTCIFLNDIFILLSKIRLDFLYINLKIGAGDAAECVKLHSIIMNLINILLETIKSGINKYEIYVSPDFLDSKIQTNIKILFKFNLFFILCFLRRVLLLLYKIKTKLRE
ncbi:MAG: hypothetical protein NkDv07_0250 [Candidatus Improbicoccus devescovinae]|nr:MAG: hypothetical protein NkDv07_0250 [Candidatus Improbicoccus devescovinae]